jgi:hypothetical protein
MYKPPEWVRSRFHFSRRAVTLLIIEREHYSVLTAICAACEQSGDLAPLEAAVRELIVTERPELAGCTIYYMGFSPDHRGWKVGIEHPLLDPIEDGMESPLQPLKREPVSA